MADLLNQLQTQFPDFKFKGEHQLAPYTTVKIGGPAEVFYLAKDQKKFEQLLSFTKKEDIKTTVLGWGANTLIADRGIRGLVILNKAGQIKVTGDSEDAKNIEIKIEDEVVARWDSDNKQGSFKYEFKDLDYDESDSPRVKVEIDAGVSLNQAIVSLINKGITGLQWYARIPSTIGGAVYNNIHGGTHFIGEVIESVRVMNSSGEIFVLDKEELEFEYDYSRFHKTDEVILSATFNLFRGDVQKAKYVYKEWNKRKSIQPHNSLGCVFKNISNQEKEKLGYPTTSVGYLVEHVLGMKDYHVGDAHVSEYHCAFIENKGQATASDYLQVIKNIIKEAKIKTGLTISPEIFFLGFEKSELEGIVS